MEVSPACWRRAVSFLSGPLSFSRPFWEWQDDRVIGMTMRPYRRTFAAVYAFSPAQDLDSAWDPVRESHLKGSQVCGLGRENPEGYWTNCVEGSGREASKVGYFSDIGGSR